MIYRYYFDIYNPDWWQEAQSMTEYFDNDDYDYDDDNEWGLNKDDAHFLEECLRVFDTFKNYNDWNVTDTRMEFYSEEDSKTFGFVLYAIATQSSNDYDYYWLNYEVPTYLSWYFLQSIDINPL